MLTERHLTLFSWYAYRNFIYSEPKTILLLFDKRHSGTRTYLTSFQISPPKELDPADLASKICSLEKLMDNVKGAVSLDQGEMSPPPPQLWHSNPLIAQWPGG